MMPEESGMVGSVVGVVLGDVLAMVLIFACRCGLRGGASKYLGTSIP
jgi:hypothetical protein